MSSAPSISQLRKLYRDILIGYTRDYDFEVYLKHFKEMDVGFLNEIREQYKKEAIKKGLQTEEEKIKLLIEQELWDKENEEKIQVQKAQIANQYQTKRKLILQSQIANIDKRIKKLEEELSGLETKRDEILGLTAEKYSDKISSEQVIRLAFFEDEEMKKPKYSQEEYDYLEPEELNNLVNIYGEFSEMFQEKNLKRIAACSFFLNNLFLCKNDPTRFYGKPIVNLTNNQLEIFSLGLSYKHVIEDGKSPPANLGDNIDALVDWYESSGGQSSSKTQDTQQKDGATVMGATAHELDAMVGGGENVVDLSKEAARKGGTLDMEDFIEIHDGK